MKTFFTFLKVGLVCLCLSLNTSLFSQIVQPCVECACAVPDCIYGGFDFGVSGTLPTSPNPTAPYPLCGGGFVPNNTQWYAFVAATTDVSLMISYGNCTQGNGVQAGIVANCFDLENSSIVCEGRCPNFQSYTLDAYGLEIGRIYYLWLDGCAGAACDYTINTINGSTFLDLPPEPTLPIIGPTSICDRNQAVEFQTLPVDGANNYNWTVDPPLPVYIDGNFLIVQDWLNAYSVWICVEAVNDCYPFNTQECIEVRIDSDNVPTEYTGHYCEPAQNFLYNGMVYTEGFYEIDLTDSNGCDSTIWLTVENNSGSKSIEWATICAGEEYEFNGQIFTQSTFGYEVIIPTPDSTDCDSVAILNLTLFDPELWIMQSDELDCEQGVDEIILSTAGSGIGNTFYSWETTDGWICDGVSDKPTLFVCGAGTYCLSISHISSNGFICSKSDCIIITESSSAPQINLTATPASCGLADGIIDIEIIGGIPPFTYEWNNSIGTVVDELDELYAAEYMLTVTGAFGCQGIASVTVEQDSDIMIDLVSRILPQCDDNGSLSIEVLNGNPPYEINWSPNANGQTGPDISGLGLGIYYATVIDADDCRATASYSMVGFNNLELQVSATTDILCNGENNGSATVEVSGGLGPRVIQWDANTGNQIGETATNLAAGDYEVTVTDAQGCTRIATVEILEPTLLELTVSSTVDVDCFGEATGEATLDISGGTPGYTIQWGGNTGGQTGLTATDLAAGTYLVNATDENFCNASATVIIQSSEELILTTEIEDPASCFGTQTGYGRVAATGGTPPYTYIWDAPGADVIGPEASALFAGDYIVTVSDALACTSTTLVHIEEGLLLNIVIGQNESIDCNGEESGEITGFVSGGSPPYTYEWSANANGATSNTLSNLGAGYYGLTVTDNNACSASSFYQLTEPDLLDANIEVLPASPGQADGEAQAIATGGTPPYFYLWLTNPPQAGSFAGGLAAGNYQLLIEDANDCETWITVSVGNY